jgi:hypothetical protein
MIIAPLHRTHSCTWISILTFPKKCARENLLNLLVPLHSLHLGALHFSNQKTQIEWQHKGVPEITPRDHSRCREMTSKDDPKCQGNEIKSRPLSGICIWTSQSIRLVTQICRNRLRKSARRGAMCQARCHVPSEVPYEVAIQSDGLRRRYKARRFPSIVHKQNKNKQI